MCRLHQQKPLSALQIRVKNVQPGKYYSVVNDIVALRYLASVNLSRFVGVKNLIAEKKLKERVKELKCLYTISKIASEEDHDLNAILAKTLTILPLAMQFSTLTEASIEVHKNIQCTAGFSKCKVKITAGLVAGRKKYGVIKIGYRTSSKKSKVNLSFLPEEKRLLKMIARALVLVIKRATIEDDKQKLQMLLQHSERMAFVGELSAGIAHELNEPLGRILGFAQLINKDGLTTDQQQSDIERIIKASLYAREIIKKLMLFSRQMPPRAVPVDVNESIEGILSFITDIRYHNSQIKFISQFEPNMPKILADPVQISQVIVNIITNAIYAMEMGGDLTISTQKKMNYIKIVVKDTGHGMSQEIQKKIFEPFFTTKSVGHGTGLGLSVVHGIVMDHNGRIEVKSAPGKGTTVGVFFPIEN